MRKLVGFLILFNMLGASHGVFAANPGEGKWVAEQVYRSANIGGLTGLIHMDSAYTLRGGEVQINAGFTTETAAGVDYQTIPIALTFGVGDNKEWALVSRYINPSVGTAGMGGAELKYKWRFRKQSEYLPASSLAFGLLLPAGETALNQVTTWGATGSLIFASEANLTDNSYIGMYLDLSATSIDPGEPTAQTYSDNSIGLLFPISNDNRLQLILEYGAINGRTFAYLGSTNYSAFTWGLRYASDTLKMTLGAENRDNNTTKVIATLGFAF